MFTNLLNLLFPKSCCSCTAILLEAEHFLCTSCSAFLPFTNQHQSSTNEAMSKFYGKVNITQASCLLYYTKNGRVSHLFHQLKYGNQPQISYILGKMYAEILSETQALKSIDWLIPVPMYHKKRKQRGYNQVDGFATALAEYYGIPINQTLLTKIAATPSQTTKNFRERISTQATFFHLTPTAEYIGKHFLLLDDILTTGTTLETCAKLLLQIPQSKVSILCLAYTK